MMRLLGKEPYFPSEMVLEACQWDIGGGDEGDTHVLGVIWRILRLSLGSLRATQPLGLTLSLGISMTGADAHSCCFVSLDFSIQISSYTGTPSPKIILTSVSPAV